MATFDTTWDFSALAGAVCDTLVKDGKLKEKPAFIRTDRQAKIEKVFTSAGLNGAKLADCNARGIEVLVRNATEGEAWVDDVQGALRGMLSAEAAASTTGSGESAELKELRAKQIERTRTEFGADAPPPTSAHRPSRACCGMTRPRSKIQQKNEMVARRTAEWALNQSRWSEPPTETNSTVSRPAALAEPPASRNRPVTPI